uniref:Uncharacterized protein n=1 Tax=Meloidogyne enterolobii TaxID=390850 RepID=A0A6V7UP78_MELEN|nr:unnamed protein product [Meloidogyne enterolobii]
MLNKFINDAEDELIKIYQNKKEFREFLLKTRGARGRIVKYLDIEEEIRHRLFAGDYPEIGQIICNKMSRDEFISSIIIYYKEYLNNDKKDVDKESTTIDIFVKIFLNEAKFIQVLKKPWEGLKCAALLFVDQIIYLNKKEIEEGRILYLNSLHKILKLNMLYESTSNFSEEFREALKLQADNKTKLIDAKLQKENLKKEHTEMIEILKKERKEFNDLINNLNLNGKKRLEEKIISIIQIKQGYIECPPRDVSRKIDHEKNHIKYFIMEDDDELIKLIINAIIWNYLNILNKIFNSLEDLKELDNLSKNKEKLKENRKRLCQLYLFIFKNKNYLENNLEKIINEEHSKEGCCEDKECPNNIRNIIKMIEELTFDVNLNCNDINIMKLINDK